MKSVVLEKKCEVKNLIFANAKLNLTLPTREILISFPVESILGLRLGRGSETHRSVRFYNYSSRIQLATASLGGATS